MCHDPDFRGKFRIVLHPNTQKADFAADPYPRTGIFSRFGPLRRHAMCHDPKKQPKIRIVLHIQGQNHPLHAPVYERPRCNRPKQAANPESEADSSNTSPATSSPANQTTQTQQPSPAKSNRQRFAEPHRIPTGYLSKSGKIYRSPPNTESVPRNTSCARTTSNGFSSDSPAMSFTAFCAAVRPIANGS